MCVCVCGYCVCVCGYVCGYVCVCVWVCVWVCVGMYVGMLWCVYVWGGCEVYVHKLCRCTRVGCVALSCLIVLQVQHFVR